ncbi:hypothetical protein [Nonomuraea sp. NPDC049784]|uniref:hypothetical protein n=1 Tax=Nonomuraea sp. NPDC049784 TaxID=3154361 RepID=UPI0033DE8761
MKRRLSIPLVTAMAVFPATVPAANAAPKTYMIRNVGTTMCLTWGLAPADSGAKYSLRTFYCQPEGTRDGYVWTRNPRSELRSLYSKNKLCVGRPNKDPGLVRMERCGIDLKNHRIAFVTVEKALGGDRIVIKWQGRPVKWQGPVQETCLHAGLRNEVVGSPCDASNGDQNWTLQPA